MDSELCKLCHRGATFLNLSLTEILWGVKVAPFQLCVITRNVLGFLRILVHSIVAHSKTNIFAKNEEIWGMGLGMNRLFVSFFAIYMAKIVQHYGIASAVSMTSQPYHGNVIICGVYGLSRRAIRAN